MTDRVASLLAMLEKRPDDSRLRFGLAAEYEKQGRWDDVVEQLRAYLASADDEGNAWGRLALALRKLGRNDEAAEALRMGIETANRHGHPSMAEAFADTLHEMDG